MKKIMPTGGAMPLAEPLRTITCKMKRIHFKKLLAVVFGFVLINNFTSCKKKEQKCDDCFTGILHQITSSCGDGWQIHLKHPDKENNFILRPVNISDFNVTLKEGQTVTLTFIDEALRNSCMDAKYVKLKNIRNN